MLQSSVPVSIKSKISEWFINKLLKNVKIYPDGSMVEYKDGKLEITPSYTTVITFKGRIKFESEDDIMIQSHKTLYLRGDILHLNDHKPVSLENQFDYSKYLKDSE